MTDRSKPTTGGFLDAIGVPNIAAATSPFDPGYDLSTLKGHLQQSAHLMSSLKISMACWLVADEAISRQKFAAAREHGVPTVTGGGPFEVAVAQGQLESYLDLCSSVGTTAIECGSGFTDSDLNARAIVSQAHARGLQVQFEVGKKHGGTFTSDTVGELIDQANVWLDAGAKRIIVEGRENAADVGVFDANGSIDHTFVERIVSALGIDIVAFEAPTKASQFAFLRLLGPGVHLCNVRLEELLRVEIYRRGIHSDAFLVDRLKPARQDGPVEVGGGSR